MSPRPTLAHIRRPQIIEAALQTMYERGFSETRIADIAERAGTSPATILYYFESKEKLLEEAMASSDRAFYQRVRDEIAELDGARAKLVAVIERCAAPADPLDDWTLWMELWLQVRHREQMREAYERLEHEGLAPLIAEVINEGQATGEFSAEAEVDDVATLLSALLDGLGVQVTLRHSTMREERMVRLCLSVASRELGCELAPSVPGARAATG
ncbi:MAG: TetR family transcriptional regulator C-terminal domain-containing protein [Solirubrobacteraceae bacterium]